MKKLLYILRRIWLNMFFRMFVVMIPTYLIFPVIFWGLSRDIAGVLYILVFGLAVIDNDGVWP